MTIDIFIAISDENYPWCFTGTTWTTSFNSKISLTFYQWNEYKEKQHDTSFGVTSKTERFGDFPLFVALRTLKLFHICIFNKTNKVTNLSGFEVGTVEDILHAFLS